MIETDDMLSLPRASSQRVVGRKGIALVLCGSLLLGACATTNGPTDTPSSAAAANNANLTPAERSLQDQSKSYTAVVAGGAGIGAAIGCGVGAGVGLLGAFLAPRAGGKTMTNVAVLCAAGAVAGGVLGGIDGYKTAKQRGDQQAEIKSIQDATAAVRADNAKLEESIKTARTVIDQTRQRLAKAQAQYKNNQITAAELQNEKSRAQANVSALDNIIAANKKKQADNQAAAQQMAASGPQATAQLDAEIAENTQKLAELQKQRDLLAQDINVGRIG